MSPPSFHKLFFHSSAAGPKEGMAGPARPAKATEFSREGDIDAATGWLIFQNMHFTQEVEHLERCPPGRLQRVKAGTSMSHPLNLKNVFSPSCIAGSGRQRIV